MGLQVLVIIYEQLNQTRNNKLVSLRSAIGWLNGICEFHHVHHSIDWIIQSIDADNYDWIDVPKEEVDHMLKLASHLQYLIMSKRRDSEIDDEPVDMHALQLMEPKISPVTGLYEFGFETSLVGQFRF